jgi:surface protein
MNCTSLTDIDLSYLDTSSIQHMSGMFYGCTSLQTVNVSNLGSDYLVSSYIFSGVGSTALTKVNMTNFNFGTQTSLQGMFSDLAYAEEFVLRNADTSNITSMNAAFSGLSNLKTIDLRGIDTSNVVYMTAMFESCSDLEEIRGLENIDTTSVTDMQAMFSNASSLTSLNLSNFDTSLVTTMAAMFSNCTGLTSINLSSFNTTSLTNMAGMFFGDTSLTTIDLSSFNTSNVTEMNLLFAMGDMGNNNTLTPVNNALTTIKVGSNWSTNSVTSDTNMFYNCTHLVGGSGTVFDSNYINKTYAHVDGGQANPGYLTQ